MGALAAFLVLTSNAHAAFHLMKVNEVSAGSGPDASWVELKMTAAGQGMVQDHVLTVRDSAGAVVDTFTFPTNVANGDNQATILIADTNGPPGADFTWPDLDLGQQLVGGAVCFDDGTPPDCASWGLSFTGAAALPDGATRFGTDLPTTNSMARVIFRGCNTLLDSPDDTDQGDDDFSTSIPSPQPNSMPATENVCPNTQITKKPQAETTDRTPRFEFAGGDSYICSLDGEQAEPCDSPYKPGKLARGKHKLAVTALEVDGSEDGTPAKYAWKIVKRQ